MLVAIIILLGLTGAVSIAIDGGPPRDSSTDRVHASACADALGNPQANWTLDANVFDHGVITADTFSPPPACPPSTQITLGGTPIHGHPHHGDSAVVRRLVLEAQTQTQTVESTTQTPVPPGTDRITVSGRIRRIWINGTQLYATPEPHPRTIAIAHPLTDHSIIRLDATGSVTISQRRVQTRPVMLEVAVDA